jgi:Zn-finger nucleic acid-binding protein
MLTCPTCLGPLVVLEHREVEIDYCPACRGCWLDRGELNLLLKGDPASDPEIRLPPGPRGARPCPCCGVRMHESAMPAAGVVVDVCPHRHGLWLDQGELQKIVNAVAQDGELAALSDFCDSVFGAAST